MASIFEIQKESARPGQTRRTTLVQEGITRLLNTSIELGKCKQAEILSKYMKKLKTNGYDKIGNLKINKKKAWKWRKIPT